MDYSKDKDQGFSLIELTIIIAVLSIIGAVGIPAFNCVRRMAISTAAQEAIRQIKDECETNFIYGIDKFTSSNPDKYQISASGSNSCSGGTITLTPEDTKLYPTYLYNFADSELSYNFKGKTGTSFIACNKLICGDGVTKKINLNQDFIAKNSYLERECSAYVHVKGPTWEEAEENAKKLGGNLVTINDNSENDWIVNSYFNHNNSDYAQDSPYVDIYWTGLRLVNNQWEWTSGEDITFKNWGYLSPYGNGDKGQIILEANPAKVGQHRNWEDKAGAWNDQYNQSHIEGKLGHYGIAEIPICN